MQENKKIKKNRYYILTSILNLLINCIFFISSTSYKNISLNIPENFDEGIDVLSSYPRSGSHWAFTILQILTKKPVINLSNTKTNLNYLNLDLDQNKPPLYRTHFPHKINLKFNTSKSKLILILRNYKECIVRHKRFTENELYNSIVKNHEDFNHYIKILNFFENWDNDQTKLLIYYEDLITQPKETITKLLEFFEETPTFLDDFYKNFEFYKKLTISIYKKETYATISSDGDKTIYHSKDFSKNLKKKIDYHVKKNHPHLWKKYLKRYKTIP